jgi:hypothetical protein
MVITATSRGAELIVFIAAKHREGVTMWHRRGQTFLESFANQQNTVVMDGPTVKSSANVV